MKKKSLISIIITLSLVLSLFCSIPAIAAESSHATASTENSIIEPYSDIIVKRYRMTTNGVLQYRRWNETKKYWVDPYWINV